jgi:hypothetical protein
MNKQELTQAIMKGSFDKGTIIRRIGVARQYLEQVYFTPNQQPFGEWAPKAGVKPEDIDVLTQLDGPFWDSFTRETMYQMLDDIRKDVGDLPTVGLYVPHRPNAPDELKYGAWLREKVNPELVMDIHVDDGVVGGCAITAAGMWRDYSVRYYMRKKRDDIIGIMTKYVEKEQKTEHTV